jgi:hypothetical protein
MVKSAFKRGDTPSKNLNLNCVGNNNVPDLGIFCVTLKIRHFGKYILNTWIALECGAGER